MPKVRVCPKGKNMSDITFSMKSESARYNHDTVPEWRWPEYFDEIFDALREYEDAESDKTRKVWYD